MSFDLQPNMKGELLTVSQLSKSFADRALFGDVSLQVNRSDRIDYRFFGLNSR